MGGRVVVDRLVGEDALHRGLRVIEVALDGDGVDVLVRRGRHLETLHLRGSDVREETEHFRALDAREALHRRGAGVTRRRCEDEDALAARRVLHEHGKHRERDILEGARLTVEELEDLHAVRINERDRIVFGETRQETIGGGGTDLGWQVIEETRHHRLFGVAHRLDRREIDRRDAGHRRHEQSAVRRKPLEHTFSARRLNTLTRRNKLHNFLFTITYSL